MTTRKKILIVVLSIFTAIVIITVAVIFCRIYSDSAKDFSRSDSIDTIISSDENQDEFITDDVYVDTGAWNTESTEEKIEFYEHSASLGYTAEKGASEESNLDFTDIQEDAVKDCVAGLMRDYEFSSYEVLNRSIDNDFDNQIIYTILFDEYRTFFVYCNYDIAYSLELPKEE